MPNIFTEDCTILISGELNQEGNIIFQYGKLEEKYQLAFTNTLKVLSQQSGENVQIVQLSLSEEFQSLIVVDFSIINNIRFLIIQNPILKFNKARDYISTLLKKKLDAFISKPEAVILILQDIENEFLETPTSSYNSYSPLLINSVFLELEELLEERKESSKQLYFSKERDCVLNTLLEITFPGLTQEHLKIKIDALSDFLRLSSTEEIGRFWFNLSIFASKTNNDELFDYILETILLCRDDYFKDLASCYAAQKYFLSQTLEAKKLMLNVQPDNLSFLSINSLISYHRLKGVIFERLHEYSSSLSEYLCAVSLMKTIANIIPELALSYAGIGNIYSLTNQHSRAITAFSFAASLFNFLSLEKQRLSMMNNINLIRTIKAKNYLTTGIISLNDERYDIADEYLEKAINEFASIIIEANNEDLISISEEIKQIIEPVKIRFNTDANAKINLNLTFSSFQIFEEAILAILKDKEIAAETSAQLKSISIPSRSIIYQIILIYHDGRMITSTKSSEAIISQGQDMIFAGAITAIQMLLKETLHTEKVHTIDAGETKILLRKGELAQTIVVANKITDQIIEYTDQFMTSFERDYKEHLLDWDGSMQELKGSKDMLDEMIIKKII